MPSVLCILFAAVYIFLSITLSHGEIFSTDFECGEFNSRSLFMKIVFLFWDIFDFITMWKQLNSKEKFLSHDARCIAFFWTVLLTKVARNNFFSVSSCATTKRKTMRSFTGRFQVISEYLTLPSINQGWSSLLTS